MVRVPRIPRGGIGDILFCGVCGKDVEEFTPEIADTNRETGEGIFVIKCHGETWRASTTRGKLDP
ncbi:MULTISPECIES: hypothetical protein [Chelativorans]|jgi:hypothetical protein|uniref:hypothetical protein n=1 Tax=Chelativorans TaxID=449972 RepID=UPI00003A328D|nr:MULTISPECIES: hypothetical protein [Chelativorans]